MRNINAFLAAVQSLGIKEKDCFTADQLYYASDFPRVMNTLSLLSKTQVAGLSGFKFFPEDASADNVAEEDGEDMCVAVYF